MAGTAPATYSIRADGRRVVRFTGNGNWIVPPGVTSIMVECWGGGGAGGTGVLANGGGGGGGAYARTENYAVTPGETIDLVVGVTANGTQGAPTWFRQNTAGGVLAVGGAVGANSALGAGAAGAGGSASACIGTVRYSGGTDSGAGGGGSAGAGGSSGGTTAGPGSTTSSGTAAGLPTNGAGQPGATISANGLVPGAGGGGQQPLGNRGTGGAGALVITYDLNGGASMGGETAGGTKKVEPARSGGSALLLAGGATKKVEALRSGGAPLAGSGSATKTVQVARTGFGVLAAVASATKTVRSDRAGGAHFLLAGGAPKALLVQKPLSGAAASLLARAVLNVAVTKGDMGAAAAFQGQGAKLVQRDAQGGAAAILLAQGAALVLVQKNAGAYFPAAGGGSKTLGIVKPLSGSVAALLGFAIARPAVEKVASGGTMQGLVAAGDKHVQADASGGAVTGIHGDHAQYSLYTFGISGITRDRFGTPVVAAKVALYRQDTYDRVAGPVLSDPLTGYYVFTTPSPASLPVLYWITMHKADYAGGPDIFGRTDEDLQPVPSLVQGYEL